VLGARMIDDAVTSKLAANFLVAAGFVGHDMGFARDILADDGNDLFLGCGFDVEGTRCAFALNEGEDSVLMPCALADFDAFFSANVGFIDLDDTACSTHWRKLVSSHGLTDTMAHEPSGLEGHAQGPVKLIGADPLLGRANQVHRLKPKMQGHMRRFENGPHAHGKWLAALVALVKAKASAFAVHLRNAIEASAMRADWTVRPKRGLDECKCGLFILEMSGGENWVGHG